MKDISKIVLGNHDITLLILNDNNFFPYIKYDQSFNEILKSHDKDILINWLKKQPLFHNDDYLKFCMMHAGILPSWNFYYCLHISTFPQEFNILFFFSFWSSYSFIICCNLLLS